MPRDSEGAVRIHPGFGSSGGITRAPLTAAAMISLQNTEKTFIGSTRAPGDSWRPVTVAGAMDGALAARRDAGRAELASGATLAAPRPRD